MWYLLIPLRLIFGKCNHPTHFYIDFQKKKEKKGKCKQNPPCDFSINHGILLKFCV